MNYNNEPGRRPGICKGTPIWSFCRLLILFLLLGFCAYSDVEFRNIKDFPLSPDDPVIDLDPQNLGLNSTYSTFGDYDLDGDLDVYVVNDGGPNALFRNDLCSYDNPCEGVGEQIPKTHTLSFTKMTVPDRPELVLLKDGVSNGRYAKWLDYDKDGDLDLYLVNDGMNRLFINDLFSPANPLDPFSDASIRLQLSKQDSFSYKVHPELFVQMGSQDDMFELTTVLTATVGGVAFPKLGTVDVFDDPSVDFVIMVPKPAPGMYLEIVEGADPGVFGNRYTILEVLGPSGLRLESEDDLAPVFRYKILTDAKFLQSNIDEFFDLFSSAGDVVLESLLYELKVPDDDFSLVGEQITVGDQLVISSTDPNSGSTLSNFLQVDSQSFTLSPPPSIGDGVLLDDLQFSIRRKKGEVLLQKFFQDASLQIFDSAIQPGDEIIIRSGPNDGKRFLIESIGTNGIVFLDSTPGSLEVTDDPDPIQYEFIYNSLQIETQRIFKDAGSLFGLDEEGRAGGADSTTRMVKEGDHLLLQPDLGINIAGEVNAAQSDSEELGTRATFADGSPRPLGVIKVLSIIDEDEIIVDSFPSEVVPGLSNNDFPYQILHQHGRLKFDLNTGLIQFFDEAAKSPVVPRDFLSSLSMLLTAGNPNNPFIILSNVRPSSTDKVPLKLQLSKYSGRNVDAYRDNSIELAQALAAEDVSATTTLEYRSIYIGLGTDNPYADEVRVLRVFGPLPPGTSAGHEIFLRSFTDTSGNALVANFRSRILNIQGEDIQVDLTLEKALPEVLVGEFQLLCANPENLCEPPPGSVDTQALFFQDPTFGQLSIEYEFITTTAIEFGQRLDFGVSSKVTLTTSGFSLGQIQISTGDSIQFKDPLRGTIFSSQLQTPTSSKVFQLENITGAIDASLPPFNEDVKLGETGILPIYRGQLIDFRRIETSNPASNFTSLARIQDRVAFFSVNPTLGLTIAAVVPIGTVRTEFVQLRRSLLLDPTLSGLDISTISTSPFYFRFIRTTGELRALPAFVDRRVGFDLKSKIKTNDDNSIRGIVLLDVFRNSNTIEDLLEKRFRLKSFISNNVAEIFPGTLNRDSDTFDNYFYEIKEVLRDNGGILENHNGNGVFAEAGDWNSDGSLDLYILNKATDPNKPTLSDNTSSLLYGSVQTSALTTGFAFLEPTVPPADQDNELLNLPSQSPITKFLSAKMVIAEDFDSDQNDDLLIINEVDPDRLFLSRAVDLTAQRELFSRLPADAAEPGELDGLNTAASLLLLKPGSRGAAVGDLNNDSTQDLYYFVGNQTSTVTRNQLFLSEGGVFKPLALPINNPLLATMESGDAVWAEMVDTDNDGFLDLSVLNSNKHFLASPRMRGLLSEGNADIREVDSCGISDLNLNRHMEWGDLNLDGYPDYYISRGGTVVETNLLCVSLPGEKELTSNHFFVFEMIPRDLSTRRVENPTRDIHGGVLTITDITDPTDLTPATFVRNFDYRYPNPSEVVVGAGSASSVNVQVLWAEDSAYDYGTVTSTLITGRKIRLLQPDDFPVLTSREVFSSGSSPASTTVTVVGPKTTNIEVTGFTLLGGSREALTVESMVIFISGKGLGESVAILESSLIPRSSVKLYMDGSEADKNSDDYSSWTPDGRFDQDHDVLLGTAVLDSFIIPENVYPGLLDGNGKVVGFGGQPSIRASFKNLAYPSRSGSLVTSIVLNPARDGLPAQRASFLAVLTIDVSGEFIDSVIEILPYIPVKVDGGQTVALERTVAAGVPQNIENFLSSPFTRTHEISLRGKESLQLHKSVSLDSASLGSRDPTFFTTIPRSALSFPPVRSLTGVLTKVDQTEPPTPKLSVCPGEVSTPVLIRFVTVPLCGTAEPFSFLQVDNSISGQRVTTQVDVNGFWKVELSGLREGENRLEAVAVDLFGNASAELKHTITVDISSPIVTNVIVTNVGIHLATVTWNTTEGAVGFVSIRSLENPGIVQTFQELSQVNFSLGHSVTIGRPNSLFGGVRSDGTLPAQCHVSVLDADLQALCPNSTYFISISVRDPLGNESLFSDLLSFRTLEVRESTGSQDLNGDGSLDLDTDGDGLPNSIEVDPRFPDLDLFDPTDALLDFDGDGISNVEEFQSGKDMYNAFDFLPIANAGADQNLIPGVVLLDGSSSNLNRSTTADATFEWTLESAPGGLSETSPTILNRFSTQTFFVALHPGEYRVSLSIQTQPGVQSEKDEMVITIQNLSPVADAGLDSIGQVNQAIFLDGSRSFDPNKEDLSFLWVQLSGPRLGTGGNFGIANFREAKTSFQTDRTGLYEFELIVQDTAQLESRDRVTFRVNSTVEIFPIADAGPDLVTSVGLPVTLQGDRSGGADSTNNLLYFWELLTSATREVPSRCEGLETNDGISVSPGQASIANPIVTFSKAGIFAFVLKVQEEGKGIFSASDCVRVAVNEPDDLIPISRPKIFGTPALFTQNSSNSVSRIRRSIQSTDEAAGVFRVPVQFEIQMSGLDSFPDHNTISASAGSTFPQAVTTNDCKALDTIYKWRQSAGPLVTLAPVVRDCSIVSFVPVEPGIYSFDLSVSQVKDAGIFPSLARKLVLLVNDPDDKVSGANNFIPSVQAPDDRVVNLGLLELSAGPKCIDSDLRASAAEISNPVGEHTLSQADLVPCTSLVGVAPLTSIECVWRQIDGPPAIVEDFRACNLKATPKKAGTYTFGIQVNDGTYTSLEDQMIVVVLTSGQSAPRANAGVDQTSAINETVQLNGQLSTAVSGGFEYLWAQTKGLPVLLRNSRTRFPSFVPPAEDQYGFQLQIRDSKGIISLPDEMNVRVSTSLVTTGQSQAQTAEEIAKAFEVQGSGGGGGCFIATAVSDSKNSWLVHRLSWFRDAILLRSSLGRAFVGTYYRLSPPLAKAMKGSPALKIMVSLFLYPIALIMGPELLWCLFLLFTTLLLIRLRLVPSPPSIRP